MMMNLSEAISRIDVESPTAPHVITPPTARELLKKNIVSWLKQVKRSGRNDLADHFKVDVFYLSTLLTELKREKKVRNIRGSHPAWLAA